MGKVRSSWWDDKRDKLEALVMKGLSYRQIALQLGASSKNAVAGAVMRFGLIPPKRQGNKKNERSKFYSRNVAVFGKINPVARRNPAPVSVKPVNLPLSASGECQWRDSDDPKSRSFCKERTVVGTSWCRTHYAIVYLPVPPSKRRLT